MKQIDWKEVWLRKGNEETSDLCVLNGHESTNFEPAAKSVVDKICSTLKVKDNDKILEVGCGAGMLAQFFKCEYVGVDYSSSLIQKHKKILGNNVFVAEANNLPFADKSFDYVFSYSVFHYFPDKKYTKEVISEMLRLTKKALFIGDLPITSARSGDHLLYTKDEFGEWEIVDSYYQRLDNAQRFNAYKFLTEKEN